jgi:two-component system chemotaxis response regulator CheY
MAPASKKALIVDDEAHIRFFLKLMLNEIGIQEIVEATNGKNAVDVYNKEKPDIVLMDVNMPILDGVGALEEIIKQHPDAFVIMLTSVATRESVENCLSKGASNYLRKDLTKEEMIKLLKESLVDFIGGSSQNA